MVSISFLDEQDAEKIHTSCVHVLEHTGIFLDHEEAETLLLEAGASKDDQGRVLISEKMVDEALEQARSKFRFWDRDGDAHILLKNGETHFGPGSDALYNTDRETKRIRLSTLADVEANVRIADALPSFDFVMSMALPGDVEPEKLYPSIFARMTQNTSKPLVITATGLADIEHTHNIAKIVAGGEEALRDKPFFLAYLEPISPLRFERSVAERVLYCAEHSIPIVFAAGANSGSAAPITTEGGVLQGSAESLAGLILALLKNEDARFIYGSNTSVMDMKTSIVSYGAPEWFRTVSMYADMGKHYDLPSWGTAGCSDSFSIDAQAAMEAYEGILMALMSGSTLVHDVGYLAHGGLYDSRMLVLTDEMITRAKVLLKPADLSDENLAVDVIDEVARKNQLYLAHEHTASKFKTALWLPPEFINRGVTVDDTHERRLVDLLSERVDAIVTNHKPKALAPEKVAQIEAYLQAL